MENDANNAKPIADACDAAEFLRIRDSLKSLEKWSSAVIAAVAHGAILPGSEARGWVNRRGSWINGGASWTNRRGGWRVVAAAALAGFNPDGGMGCVGTH